MRAFVVMGVSGCGKSTVGRRLSERIGGTFIDADDYHSTQSIEKMRAGIPLSDEDRWAWLEELNHVLIDAVRKGELPVLACSALKEAYRKRLRAGGLKAEWIYLRGSFEEISQRLESRRGHFMPAQLLRSQFEALEEPSYALVFEISRPVEEIVNDVLAQTGAGV